MTSIQIINLSGIIFIDAETNIFQQFPLWHSELQYCSEASQLHFSQQQ